MGKTLADLQSDISISAENAVTGTLLWVDDYTGFSGDPAEQSGNYIALKISAEALGEALEGATITATYHGRTVTLDSDQIIIVRQAEGEDTITFTANKEGYTEGRLTLDFSGLTLTPEPAKFSLSCNTTGVTFAPNGTMAGGVATFEITATGQVPYDTTTSSNLINMTLTTNASPTYDQTDDSILVAYVDSSEVTHTLYTGNLTWSDDVGTATFDCPITADSITYSPVIAIVVDGTNATRVSQVLDTSALTLEPEPQTLTISIPENNELVAQTVNDSTKQAPTSYFFAPSGDQKITTITNVSSDGRTMSIGADSGNTDGSRRLYSMYTLKPLNGEGNTTMNGATIPIKITRLDSTNTVKFRKGNDDHTNRNVSFNNDNVGYILTGPSWNNDWPYYIDVYNSSNELIDTYTINCLGYAYSYDWSISPISDFSSNGAYSQLVRSTLAADSDIVPNIEDASGNPVSVATFHENLTLPSSISGQISFASGTVHYVQGLKYSDTQTPLADGYYMIMKIPAYSGTQGNQISKMRSNQFGNSTGRQDYSLPTTDKILMPIPWGTDVNSGTLTTEIFPYFYNSMEIVSYRNLHYQPNLTIDPVPPTLTELTSYDVNNVQFTKAQLYGNEGRMIVHGNGDSSTGYTVQIDGTSFKAVNNPDYPDDTTPYFGALSIKLPITYTYSGNPVVFDTLINARVASGYGSYLEITGVDTTNNIAYFKLKKDPSTLGSQKFFYIDIKASSNNYTNNFKVYFSHATVAT